MDNIGKALSDNCQSVLSKNEGKPVLRALSLLFFLFASGCIYLKGPSGQLDQTSLPSAEKLYSELLEQSEQIGSLHGTARIRGQALLKRVRLEALIACDDRGRLRLEVLDFLDRIVFSIVYQNDRFVAYSVAENRFIEGFDDRDQIHKLLGVPIKIKELVALALAKPFFIPLKEPQLSISQEEDSFLLEAREKNGSIEYHIWFVTPKQIKKMQITRTHSYEGSHKTVQIDFDRYKDIDSISFPYYIRVTDLENEDFFEIDYQKLNFNAILSDALFQFNR